jgi:hypothetical protein
VCSALHGPQVLADRANTNSASPDVHADLNGFLLTFAFMLIEPDISTVWCCGGSLANTRIVTGGMGQMLMV